MSHHACTAERKAKVREHIALRQNINTLLAPFHRSGKIQHTWRDYLSKLGEVSAAVVLDSDGRAFKWDFFGGGAQWKGRTLRLEQRKSVSQG